MNRLMEIKALISILTIADSYMDAILRIFPVTAILLFYLLAMVEIAAAGSISRFLRRSRWTR